MIMTSAYDDYVPYVGGIKDHTYDDNAWITEVGETVATFIDGTAIKKIAVIGHDKDHSSFYLNYFPQWDFIPVPSYPEHSVSIDATKIRRLMFENDIEFIKGVVPPEVFEQFVDKNQYADPFLYSENFALLQKEWDFIKAYKDSWAGAPYEPTFVTVDGVVIQSGHILLIQRGEFPGNGLWAMPGGFVNPKERVRTAVTRELREETGLKLPVKVLDRAIDAYEMFDDPGRSTRGRTITHTYRITLDPTQKLPKVKGMDDAKDAEWVPLSKIADMENVMYEDHYYIIRHMLALPATAVRGGI
jgi:bifunctional NMN adenylyltransferase/nudix hydrolase